MKILKIILLCAFFAHTCLSAKIDWIIDGDTLKVDGKIIRVLEVDTFESRRNKQAKRQAEKFGISVNEVVELGKQAKQLAINNWKGREVELKCWKKDRYKRNLCYVYDAKTKESYAQYMIDNKLGWYVKPY